MKGSEMHNPNALGPETGVACGEPQRVCRSGVVETVRDCALITGASQGLGRALAEQCARLRMDLILVALPDSGLEEAAREISAEYRVRCAFYETDLAAEGSPEALFAWIAGQKEVRRRSSPGSQGRSCRYLC